MDPFGTPQEKEEERWRRFAPLLLVLAGILAYANSFSGVFLYDDPGSIVQNPTIRTVWPPWEALSPPRTDGLTVSGRPVLNYSLALNYAAGGLNPWGYHAVNLAIHLGAALLLFGLVRRTLAPPAASGRVAFTVALLWLLHPLQTESVTYIVQRAESLMGFFYLLTLYTFARGARSGRPAGWWILCTGSCLLGMGTKEVMVSAPVLVLLFDRTFFAGTFAAAWRLRRGLYTALAATWVPLVLLVLSLGGNRGGTIGPGLGFDLWGHWLIQVRSIAHYLRLAIWPDPLVFDYGPETAPGLGAIWWRLLVLGGLVGGTLWCFRRRRIEGLLGLWFFAVLAPTSLMPGEVQVTVEHRMYLALAPLLVAVVLAGHRWLGRGMPVAALVVAGVFGALTAARNRDYHSEIAIWADTVEKLPGHASARNNLGVALFEAGRFEEAAREYEAALRLQAGVNDRMTRSNLGTVMARMGRVREALTHFEAAMSGPDPEAGVLFNYGTALFQLGEHAQALARFEEATRLQPGLAPAWNMQGMALAVLGRMPEAIARFEEGLRHADELWEITHNLGLALLRVDRLPEAIRRLEQSVLLRPERADFRVNLGEALVRADRLTEAEEQFREAIRLRPEDPYPSLTFAAAQAAAGRNEAAETIYEDLLRRLPRSVEAHEAFAELLGRMPGREIEAARHFAEANRLRDNP